MKQLHKCTTFRLRYQVLVVEKLIKILFLVNIQNKRKKFTVLTTEINRLQLLDGRGVKNKVEKRNRCWRILNILSKMFNLPNFTSCYLDKIHTMHRSSVFHVKFLTNFFV